MTHESSHFICTHSHIYTQAHTETHGYMSLKDFSDPFDSTNKNYQLNEKEISA